MNTIDNIMAFYYRFLEKVFPYDMTFSIKRGSGRLNSIEYTFYRIIMFALIITNFVLVEIYSHQADLLYFTYWGLLLSLTTFGFMVFENIASKTINRMWTKSLWKISHSVFVLTLVIEMFINGIYWFGMFPFAIKSKVWGDIGFEDVLVNVFEHAFPLIILTIDLHVNYAVVWNYGYMGIHYLFLVAYLLINVTYTVLFEPVYPMITYSNWLSYLFLLACLVTVPICHFIALKYCQYFKASKINEIKEANILVGSTTPNITTENKAVEDYASVFSDNT